MSKYTKNIGVKTDVYDQLEEKKSPGQSFTGVVQELIQKAEKFEKIKQASELEQEDILKELLEEAANCEMYINKIENKH